MPTRRWPGTLTVRKTLKRAWATLMSPGAAVSLLSSRSGAAALSACNALFALMSSLSLVLIVVLLQDTE